MRRLVFILCLIGIPLLFVQCKSNEDQIISSSDSLEKLRADFLLPSTHYRPETWFHLNGNNISKEGLTLDLEAIKYAGLQGIHLFNKSGQLYPGVDPIKILSPEWEDMIRHAADECKRLGLKFTMQNCPGWSMTGGPWVPVEEAQRELVETVYRVNAGSSFDKQLKLDEKYLTEEYNYQDVQLLAFPTPEGDNLEVPVPINIESNNSAIPWTEIFNPNKSLDLKREILSESLKTYKEKGIGNGTWVKLKFDQKVMIRSIEMSPIREMLLNRDYPVVKMKLKVQAMENDALKDIAELQIPSANWTDTQYNVTLSIPETYANLFVITFIGEHHIAPANIQLSAKPRLHNHEVKAAKTLRSLEKEVMNEYIKSAYIDPETIINLSGKMDKTGRLNWDAPDGDWTIVRFGHVNMRRQNKPAVPEATGWEASKLDKIAIENHLRNGMIGNLIKDGGPIGDGKLHGLLIDSWESFIPTWSMDSENLFNEFKQRRGYDMQMYLPATIGYIVKSPEVTTKFLRDLRQTMDDLFIENFFEHFATVAHEMGAQVYTEGAGGEVLPIDPMRYYGVSDIPMTEFWYPKPPSNQNEYAKPILSAASATHLYNKPFLAAEACTQLGVKWNEHPLSVKSLIDYNFTKGVNHLVFHTFSHTPQTDVYPGSSFGGNIGFPLVRQQTWWKHMPDWIDYLSRNQYMLQQGEYVADVLWYYGDHFERPPFDVNDFPKGYRYDYLNEEILQEKLTAKDGKINVKDAGDYRIILLRDSKEMLLSTAEKLKELVLGGAVIVGDKPLDSPSLMDDENDVKTLTAISDALWDNTKSGVKQVGKGKVYWGTSIKEVLKAESIQPDVIVPKDADIDWIHRQTEDADIYFVSTKSENPIDVSLSFRVDNAYPQFWDAFTGKQQDAMVWSKGNERINVAVSLDESGSAILVFPKGNKEPYATKVDLAGETILSSEKGWYRAHTDNSLIKVSMQGNDIIATKSGTYKLHRPESVTSIEVSVHETSIRNDWKAAFEAGWDTPESIAVPQLKSLTDFDNEAIKHYSGTVTYAKNIDIENESENMVIDLGQVGNIAEVWLNGEKVGTRWAPPYTFDMTGKLKKGTNQLEIKVTNTWRNQLIYDNTRPKGEKKTWTTNGPKIDEIELEKSGLIGPVTLKTFK